MLSYGMSFGEVCRKHAEEYGVKRIYILASGTLSRNTELLQDLKKALDGMVVGERIGMTSHTLVSEVVEVLHDVRRTRADCIVTLGGESLSDAAKAITFVRFFLVLSHTSKRLTRTRLRRTMFRHAKTS